MVDNIFALPLDGQICDQHLSIKTVSRGINLLSWQIVGLTDPHKDE